MSAIRVADLVKTYGSRRVLEGVDLDIQEGDFYALMGPNGSGKTTLASIIASVRTQDSGTAEVYGKSPALARELIGYVPQEHFSSPELSGKENLIYFARLLGYSRSQAVQLTAELLDKVGLTRDLDKRVGKYSGGMRKRLEVATAMFPGVRVLILDEPTTGLDPAARRSFFGMLQERIDRKTTVLLVTHIGSDAELASRVGLIDNGRVIAEGTPDELKRRYAVEDAITVETAVKTEGVVSLLKGFDVNERVAELDTGYRVYLRNGDRVLADMVRTLDQAGYKVQRIEMGRPTLEDVFFRLTQKTLQEVTE